MRAILLKIKHPSSDTADIRIHSRCAVITKYALLFFLFSYF